MAWFGFSFGSFASQPALGFGDLHPFSGAQPDQIGLALRNHPERVEQVPSDGIGGVVIQPPRLSLTIRLTTPKPNSPNSSASAARGSIQPLPSATSRAGTGATPSRT